MRYQGGNEGIVDIPIPLKDVPVDTIQMVKRVRFRIDVDWRSHRHIETADLIKTESVINVVVRKQDCITTINAGSQNLLSQIRRGIDQDRTRMVIGINESNGC